MSTNSFTPAQNDGTSFSPALQLFAGEAPITTNRAQGGVNINLAQYTVIALVSDLIVAWDPTGSGAVTIPVGILATDMDSRTSGGVPGRWAPYYTGGDFNHEALVWPASIDTFAERRAAFSPVSTIKISKVL